MADCVPVTPLIETVVVLVVVQLSAEDCPAVIVDGFAVKAFTTGGEVVAVRPDTSALISLVTVLLLLLPGGFVDSARHF